jgi:1-acyl-sn-glycerol-3-phosphate acyltransferase
VAKVRDLPLKFYFLSRVYLPKPYLLAVFAYKFPFFRYYTIDLQSFLPTQLKALYSLLYMKWLQIFFRIVFSIYGFTLFLLGLFLIFPIVVIASFFGKIKGGNFIYKLCKLWAASALKLWGIYHSIHFQAPHDSKKQYVFVFNHISYMDIPVLMMAFSKQHFRILGKAELSKIPIFGFLYRKTVVLVERDNATHRTKSVQQLKSIIRKGISVVIAPEGTFNTTNQPLKEFYDGAFRVAIETQTPIKPILFLDTHDRLRHDNLFSLNPGRSRIVYLEEVSVAGLEATDTKMLKAKVFKIMEEQLIAYKASWIKPTQISNILSAE